jgi:signal transduction histidine kinase
VRDVTEEVTARRESAYAEEARQEFLASFTHDIKRPLAVIKGHAQVLRRQMNRRGTAPPPGTTVSCRLADRGQRAAARRTGRRAR